MRPLMTRFILGVSIAFGFAPAHSQLDRGSGGDLRVDDRPITAPSLSPDPTRFFDPVGAKPSGDILKSLDKELARSPVEPPPAGIPRDRPMEARPGADLGKRPPAYSTFR